MAALLVIAGGLAYRHLKLRPTGVVRQPTLVATDGLKQLDLQSSELVGDTRQDGRFRIYRALHLVTFVSHANAQTNRKTPRILDALEPEFYERLLFGDRLDNERDKNNCHFRLRIKHPECLRYRSESLLLHLQTDKDAKQLDFEWVNGSLVSRPFILVDQIKEPSIAGLAELLTDARWGYAIFSRD